MGHRWLLAPALVAGALLGCGSEAEPPPNVLLIVVDTLGAHHLGCYGAPTRTPHIDALARGGVRFERAFATAPWTMPSVASILTGRMPSRHGVRGPRNALADDETTLAEILGEKGYATHAVISHFLIGSALGYGQGFDSYDGGPIRGHDGITSQDVTDRALELLAARQDEHRPFLILAHYFDPHAVYHHHRGRFLHTPYPVPYAGPVQPGMDIWALREIRGDLSEIDVEYLRGLYREEVAYTDHHVGRLVDGLAERGLREKTLVILTSDHGEELMEHGWIGHTRTLYDDLLRVPLIFSQPGTLRPHVVATPVSLVDVVPTVAQLVGAPARPEWDGVSLVSLLRGEAEPTIDRPVFAEVSFGRDPKAPVRNALAAQKAAHKTAVVRGDLKLIHDEGTGQYELYDLAADPAETRDLWQREGAGHPLLELLTSWEAARASPQGADSELSATTLDQLHKLGYVR